MLYQVARTDRQSVRRTVLEVVASGLSFDSASKLAASLRAQNADTESLFGWSVQAMPVHAQVSHLTAGETMAALAFETPLRRAA
jgi:hypothetical protein